MKLFLATLLSILTFATGAFAETICPPYVSPEIAANILWQSPKYDDTLDIQGIGLISAQNTYQESAKDEFPMGFTEAVQKLTTSFAVKTSTLPNGKMCAQIDSLKINFGYPDVTVYVARDILTRGGGRDGCAYREMKDHELQHVAADKKIAETYAPYFKRLGVELAQGIGVIPVDSQSDAETQIRRMIDAYMARLNINMTTVHNNTQLKIDTPEEYRRLSSVCDGAMAKLLPARFKK
jgi:hypothetical protein